MDQRASRITRDDAAYRIKLINLNRLAHAVAGDGFGFVARWLVNRYGKDRLIFALFRSDNYSDT